MTLEDIQREIAALPTALPTSGDVAAEKPARPRTDTVALVEQNAARPREVPTWLAVVAIVALSLVAGMTTYLVRMKTAGDSSTDPGTTTTASAAYDKGAVVKPRVPAREQP